MKIEVADLDTLIDNPPSCLESFAILAICVAGKTARVIRRCLEEYFWNDVYNTVFNKVGNKYLRTHFDFLRVLSLEEIARILKDSGIGCHSTKSRAIHGLVNSGFDLRTVTIEQLESIYGIGPKTARFFILYTQPGAKVACLDTHVLKWMKSQGIDVPKSTPTGSVYKRLESEFLNMVPRGKTIAEFDLEIWRSYRR